MISQETITRVRERASIVELISDYVTLKKSGRNFMGLCPFHSEKTPSFTVSDEKGIFHCFGCQAGGSVFHFLMKYDHLSFPEAVERVAKRYGIVIEQTGAPNRDGQREALYRINELAAAHYHRLLLEHPDGNKARQYVKSRGVSSEFTRRFLLGFAPASGSGLVGLLKKEGIALGDAIRLGLIAQRGPEQLHEKFFSRLMFPIVNAAGKVVGFGGRVLDHGFPKYLNSSETPLFRKSSVVYGLHQAKESIRKVDQVVIVEGYLDVIALHQFEIAQAVATLGTALTADHLRVLARYTKNIVALFDGDEAGGKAAARSFEIFLEAGLLGRAAFLPKGEDPDTFVRRHGRDAVQQTLERAVPLADYFFSWLEQVHGKTLEAKTRIATELSRLLTRVQNPFEMDLLVQRASERLGIREEILRRNGTLAVNKRPTPVPAAVVPQARDDIAERSLIGLMLRFPAVVQQVVSESDTRRCFDAKWQPFFDRIIGEWQEKGKVDASELIEKLSPEEAALITRLALEGEKIPEADYAKVAADCLAHLRRRHLRVMERNLRSAIRAAEEQNDDKAKRERILEWQDVVRRERQLERRKLEAKNTPRH